MGTEDAGGLSTGTLDSLLGFVKDGEVRDAARAELAALVEAAGRAAVAEAVLLAVVNKGHRSRCPRSTSSRERAACTCGVDTVGDALDALRAGGAGEGGMGG
jgi:hypothetical protein